MAKGEHSHCLAISDPEIIEARATGEWEADMYICPVVHRLASMEGPKGIYYRTRIPLSGLSKVLRRKGLLTGSRFRKPGGLRRYYRSLNSCHKCSYYIGDYPWP